MIDINKTTRVFPCPCSDPEHHIIYNMFDDEEEIYLHVQLNNGKWYQRVWKAIKYVFGYKCKFGHFDEFIISSENYEHLKAMVNHIDRIKLEKLNNE